jgi:hypothetical protein
MYRESCKKDLRLTIVTQKFSLCDFYYLAAGIGLAMPNVTDDYA